MVGSQDGWATEPQSCASFHLPETVFWKPSHSSMSEEPLKKGHWQAWGHLWDPRAARGFRENLSCEKFRANASASLNELQQKKIPSNYKTQDQRTKPYFESWEIV